MQPSDAKFLVLGLGNDLLSDDAAGLAVIRYLTQAGMTHPAVQLQETTEMGLALLDLLVGYEAAVIVDSIQTGAAAPGTVHELDAAQLSQWTSRTPHLVGVTETLALGRLLGLTMPRQVRIVAVEVADPFTLGTALTPAVAQALPVAAEQVRQALRAVDGPDLAQCARTEPASG